MSRLNRKSAQRLKMFLGDKIPHSISELQRQEGSLIDTNDFVPDCFQYERENIEKTVLTPKITVFFIPEKGLNADYPLWVVEQI